MGKLKNALIAWNEDNDLDPSQIEVKPRLKDLVKIHEKNRKLINKILWKRRK